MTQQPLGFSLADRVARWAKYNDGGTFDALCDAMGVNASDVDIAARKAGALRWVDGKGYEVGFEVTP